MNILLHGMNLLNKLVLVARVQKMTRFWEIFGIQGGGGPGFSRFRGDLLKWGEDNYSGGGGVETPVGGMPFGHCITGLAAVMTRICDIFQKTRFYDFWPFLGVAPMCNFLNFNF